MSFFRFKYITIAIVLCITGQVSHAEQIIQYPNSKITASSILPITKDKLNLIVLAAQLCNATYDANYARTVVPSANYVQQPNGGADAALTLDIDDAFCIVAFRGSLTPTKISNDIIEDWIFQNLNANPLFVNKRNDITQGCTVQEGFFKAYAGVGIAPIESFIDTCMSAGSKQLVFTGHSQGGAVAAIASIVYNDYNPLTITFGQPPFVRRDTDCPILNKHHVWRIINTENSRNGLQYDPVRE